MVFLFREKIKIKLTTCRGFYHIDGTLGFNSTPGSSEPYSCPSKMSNFPKSPQIIG